MGGFWKLWKIHYFLWRLPYFKNPPNIAHQKKRELCENPLGKMSSVGNCDSNRILKHFFWLKGVDLFPAKILFYNCIWQRRIYQRVTVWIHLADLHKTQTKYRSVSQPNIATISLILYSPYVQTLTPWLKPTVNFRTFYFLN